MGRLDFRFSLFCGIFLGCFVFLVSGQIQAAGEGVKFLGGGVPSSPAPEIPGVRALGMGNSGLALADGPESFYLNPAGMGFMDYSYLEAGFYFHPNADNRVFNVSIADGKTNPMLAGGLSYSYYTAARPDDGKFQSIAGHIIRVGSAYTYKKILSVGLVVKYLYLERPFFTPINGVNLDIGVTWQIVPGLRVSAVGYNLIYNDTGETPIAIGLGVAFGGLKNLPFRASIDWVMDFQSRSKIAPGEFGHELRIGAAYTIARIFTIRGGYQFDQARDMHHLSLGLGFKYKRFGLEAAYRQQVGTDDSLLNHFFGFTGLLYF